MNLLTIDIETLPSDRPEPINEEERIQFLSEALDGSRGRILCISYVDELIKDQRSEGVLGCDPYREAFHLNEALILEEFWDMMQRFDPRKDRLIGWNVLQFDWPFILKRSWVHGVKPTRHLSLQKYRSAPIWDGMMIWDSWAWGKRTSLQNAAEALGLEGKTGDGSMVYQMWKEGRHAELYNYSLQDSKLMRQVYSRMVFEK